VVTLRNIPGRPQWGARPTPGGRHRAAPAGRAPDAAVMEQVATYLL